MTTENDVTVTVETSGPEKVKKDAKIRTSITINPEVLNATRAFCAANAVSVSSYIEDALVAKLASVKPGDVA